MITPLQSNLRAIILAALVTANFSLIAQETEPYRGDTTNFSIYGRGFVFSMCAGFEVPIKQSAISFVVGQKSVPQGISLYEDFNNTKYGSVEYRRYLGKQENLQFFAGAYALLKHTDYGGPEESEWEGGWYESDAFNVGPIIGFKVYPAKRLYFDFLLGAYGGKQWGRTRLDYFDPDRDREITSYQDAKKFTKGIRFSIAFGLHPFRKRPQK